jgi:hypothetical protein
VVVYSYCRPLGTNHPEGGPGTAAKGHVGDINDDEAGVVLLLALQADTRAAIGCLVCRVDAPLDGAGGGGVCVDEVGLASGLLVDVLYESWVMSVYMFVNRFERRTICGVGLVEKVKAAKEVRHVVVFQHIARHGLVDQGGCRRDKSKRAHCEKDCQSRD